MRIEIGSGLALAARDSLLLASDGLFDNIELAEIVACIRCGRLEDSARRLLEVCVQRMRSPAAGEPSKPDDLSFVLFRPGGA